VPIAFHCSGCNNPLRVPDELAGRKGKCPRCGALMIVYTTAPNGQMTSSEGR
jgi:hypothetical protein